MKKLIAVCLAALAAFGASAATVKTATQPWVEAKIDAATNGLVTASVTNGLASLASLAPLSSQIATNAADIATNAAAIADETKARQSLTTADIMNPARFFYNGNAKPLVEQLILTNSSSMLFITPSLIVITDHDGKNAKNILMPKYAGTLVVQGDLDDYATTEDLNQAISRSAGDATGYTDRKFSTMEYDFSYHANNTENPHGVTAAQVGTYTTSEIDSKISAATTNALDEVEKKIPVVSATDATFSNAVLQVGIGTLGITTNDLQVVHDLTELPVGTSITTVGGLLAALAAGLAALKKTVSTLSSKVDDANAALEEVA